MQTQRFFSLRWATLVGSLALAACLTFSLSSYDTARGFSIASVSSPVSNTASKGDRLTSRHPNASAPAAMRHPVIRKSAMNKNNDKFNDQVKRNVEELHKLKEDVKKTDDPKIRQRIEQLYNKKDDQ
jgi:hypothetical protein